MSILICDICGTSYSDDVEKCPTCGYSRAFEELTPYQKRSSSAHEKVRGGRFSKKNVRKRLALLEKTRSQSPEPAVMEPREEPVFKLDVPEQNVSQVQPPVEAVVALPVMPEPEEEPIVMELPAEEPEQEEAAVEEAIPAEEPAVIAVPEEEPVVIAVPEEEPEQVETVAEEPVAIVAPEDEPVQEETVEEEIHAEEPVVVVLPEEEPAQEEPVEEETPEEEPVVIVAPVEEPVQEEIPAEEPEQAETEEAPAEAAEEQETDIPVVVPAAIPDAREPVQEEEKKKKKGGCFLRGLLYTVLAVVLAAAAYLGVTYGIPYLKTMDWPTQPVAETTLPTEEPTQAPTDAPTEEPTPAPTEAPTEAPTDPPTEPPTEAPTDPPTEAPTEAPTEPLLDVKLELNYYDLTFGAPNQGTQLEAKTIPNEDITWISDDPSVVTISETGKIISVGGGKTTVRAIYGDQEVTVKINCAF